MGLYFKPWRRYVDFSGRSTRSEYWVFTIVNNVVLFALQMVAGAMSADLPDSEMGPAAPVFGAYFLLVIALILPSLAVGVRRLHDSGRSGWMIILVNIFPLAALYFMTRPGTVGPNEYGFPEGADVAEVF